MLAWIEKLKELEKRAEALEKRIDKLEGKEEPDKDDFWTQVTQLKVSMKEFDENLTKVEESLKDCGGSG